MSGLPEPYQELILVDGIEFVGPLPLTLQYSSVVSAAVMHDARNLEASTALVNFPGTPEAVAVIKAKGMMPVSP